MAEKKICDVCGKKINGINSIANIVEESVLCSSCYEKLKGFKVTKKYSSMEELEKDQSLYMTMARQLEYGDDIISSLEKHFQRKKRILEEKQQAQQYLMTTGSFLQGYTIEKYLGIVSGQVVIGSGFFSSFEASLADLSGTEASGYTDKLDLAKEVAQKRAVYKSVKLGGNALIGVDVEYTTFTNDLMSVIFTGTSVLVRRDDKSE